MKKILYTLFFILFLSGSITTYAQTAVDLAANDSLIIELEGYKQGTIQWQTSTNGNIWTTISNPNNPETLRYKITTPRFIRSRIADGTCNLVISDTVQANVYQDYAVNAGHGYVESEPYVASSGITMRESGALSQWTDVSKKAVWFLYQKPGTYTVSFNMSGTTNRTYELEMNTSPAYEGLEYVPQSFPISYTAKGGTETVETFTVTIPTTGYYRYELGAKSSSMSGLIINRLLFQAKREPASPTLDTHATDYLSSPSVHISFTSTAPTTNEYDWLYEEIVVPEGYDPTATYYMSIGFFAGYMGIQTNSTTERRVLFSTWDALDKDRNPNLPEDVLVTLVDKGPNTQANAFGNEGTGGQSYVGSGNVNTWKTGRPVKFLMNARRDGERDYHGIDLYNSNGSVAVTEGDKIKHTIVSAWYDANDGEGWQYIASWRAKRIGGARDMFDGFHSFLENFGYANGQMNRRAYYYNAFGKELTTEKWINFNRVSFSNTDGSEGQRIDYGQGVDKIQPDKFFMHSGGYGNTEKVGNSATLPLLDPVNVPAINDLDLTPFIARVDAAMEREEFLNNMQLFDKTNWTVPSFSSEEKTGESDGNGFAAKVIDGDENTYWHSQWNGGAAPYPHWLVVDMTKEQTIRGFKISHPGRQDRKMKEIKLEVSNSPDSEWSEVWSGEAIFAPELIELESAATGRYFKLTVNSGTASDGPFINVFEIDVF